MPPLRWPLLGHTIALSLGLSGVQLLSFMALNFLYLPRIGGSTDPPGDSVGAKKVHQVTSELEAGMQGAMWVLGEGL